MVVNSVISVVYYLAIAKQMMFVDVEDAAPLRTPRLVTAVVGLSAVTVIAVGDLPRPVREVPAAVDPGGPLNRNLPRFAPAIRPLPVPLIEDVASQGGRS